MSGRINPDWVYPGGRIREIDEIQDEEAGAEGMHLDEARRGEITIDESRCVENTDGASHQDSGIDSVEDSQGMKETIDRASRTSENLNAPETKRESVLKLKERNDRKPSTREDTNTLETKAIGMLEMHDRKDKESRAKGVDKNTKEAEGSAEIRGSEGARSRGKGRRANPVDVKVIQDVHLTNADNKECKQLPSVTNKNIRKLVEGNSTEIKSTRSQSRYRSTFQTCGILPCFDSGRKGDQLTPVETDSTIQMQIKPENRRDNVEISAGNLDHDTKDSPCLEKPTIGPQINDTARAIETNAKSKDAALDTSVTKEDGNSEEDGSSSDGDFSTGSSSSNSLGDIEGVIARMTPACRQKVVRPLKITQSLQSSNSAQKHKQRVVSKSETASCSGASGYQRAQNPVKDVTNDRKQRETGNQSKNTRRIIPTVSVSPSQATSVDIPDRFISNDVSDIRRQDNSLVTSQNISSSAHGGQSSVDTEDFSDGDLSTGSSELGDIKDILEKMSSRTAQLGEKPMNPKGYLKMTQLDEKLADRYLAKSDTDSARISKKGVLKQEQREKEMESTDCSEVTNEIETDEQRLTEDTVTVDGKTMDATHETQPPSLKRNPRFARKRCRATTPKAKPRKRIVNFASFENIRLFSSAKHLLVTSSLVGNSRVRVKKGVITPEEKALREEEIREQTKMDSDEKMEKQLNFRMGLLKKSLSDSDQEEGINGYYQKDQPSESLVNTSGEVVEPLENTSCETAEPLENTFCETAEPLENTSCETAEPLENTFCETAEPLENTFCETAEPLENTFCEVAEPLENTPCEDTTADAGERVISPYPDFSVIPSGDIEGLNRATDAFLEMIDQPEDKITEMTTHKMVGRPTGERMVGSPSNEDEVLARAKDPVVDTAVDWSSDDKYTPPAVENVRPAEQPVRRAGKLTRFIRGVGSMFRKAIDRTRRLTATCCLKPATD